MTGILAGLAVLVVLAVAGWLRFAQLGNPPLHFDEATGARITADQLETGRYQFDPHHFHGPLLSNLSGWVLRLRGETSWEQLTKENLRLTIALASLLAVVAALGVRRFGGAGDGLAAAAFLATCPLLAYYGRIFIHETIFTAIALLTLLVLLRFLQRPGMRTAAGLGIGIGLLAVTRETFVIVLFAWLMAGLAWPWPDHAAADGWRERLRYLWKRYARSLWLAVGLALAMIAVFYTDFGRHPRGLIDFLRTYITYDLGAGHEKPFLYYLELLLWPQRLGGVWWTEIGVLLFALYGYASCRVGPPRAVCRFLVHGGAVYLLVFSLLAYKNPWLPCVGWMHFCLAAGLGAGQLVRDSRGAWKLPAIAAVLAVLAWQGVQGWRAVSRFAVDARNPYAYVPTSRDVERMTAWLTGLTDRYPELDSQPVAVVGGSYWPLPWYLRTFDQVGYWESLPPDADTRPLLLLVSQGVAANTAGLERSHVFFPRGLRHEVLVTVAIRKDIWDTIEARRGS